MRRIPSSKKQCFYAGCIFSSAFPTRHSKYIWSTLKVGRAWVVGCGEWCWSIANRARQAIACLTMTYMVCGSGVNTRDDKGENRTNSRIPKTCAFSDEQHRAQLLCRNNPTNAKCGFRDVWVTECSKRSK